MQQEMQCWANTYTKGVRQRTVRQETTMCKSGTLPHYLYASKNLVPIKPATAYNESTSNRSSIEIEEDKENDIDMEKYDTSSDEDEQEFENGDTNDGLAVDRQALFLVGRSTRFGRAVKINNKFIQ